MSYDLVEKSRALGKPIGLVRLSRGALLELYTTADRPITIGAETYEPLEGLTRSEIRDSTERKKNVVTLTLPIDAPCAGWWYPFPRSRAVGVVWLAMHRGESEIVVEWIGRVVVPKRTDTHLTLSCEQSKSGAASRGLVLRWQRGCPLALYSQGLGMCNVDKALYALPATLTGVAGAVVTSVAFASVPGGKSLAGGFFEWLDADGEPELRSIMAHDGDTIVLNYGAEDLDLVATGTAYPGCPHDWDGCVSFNNSDNYGGALYSPNKSPFDGNPV